MTAPQPILHGAHVFIVEDDFYLATDLRDAFEATGARVAGPFPSEAAAVRALDEQLPDCAFIDINLGHGPTYAVARALARAAIPFAFVTGYDAAALPAEFGMVERMEKPIDGAQAIAAARRWLAPPA